MTVRLVHTLPIIVKGKDALQDCMQLWQRVALPLVFNRLMVCLCT